MTTVGIVVSGVLASAAGIPVVSAKLRAWTLVGGSGAPRVYAFDNFNVGFAILTGRPLTVGGTWATPAGTWIVLGNVAQLFTNTLGANATTNTGQNQVAAQVALLPSGKAAGVVFNDDGTNRMAAYFETSSGGRIRLETVFGTTRTIVATVNGLGTPPAGSSLTLRVETQGSQVRVKKDGVLVLTHNLTATQQAVVRDADNTRFGLWADQATASTFDNFRVESL